MKDMAAKYGILKSTLSTWVKSKEKRLNSLEKGSNINPQKLRTSDFEMGDKSTSNWFLSMLTQNVCSIISCHDSTEDGYIHQSVKCREFLSIRWLVATLEGKKPHNCQDCIRRIDICSTSNG